MEVCRTHTTEPTTTQKAAYPCRLSHSLSFSALVSPTCVFTHCWVGDKAVIGSLWLCHLIVVFSCECGGRGGKTRLASPREGQCVDCALFPAGCCGQWGREGDAGARLCLTYRRCKVFNKYMRICECTSTIENMHSILTGGYNSLSCWALARCVRLLPAMASLQSTAWKKCHL